MKDEKRDLRERTKDFALRVIRLYSALPKKTEAQVMGKQFLRSGTSVGAQYREGYRAKSKADMVSKFEGCIQELEETRYWLELLVEVKIIAEGNMRDLISECDELISIFVSSVRTLKGGNIHRS